MIDYLKEYGLTDEQITSFKDLIQNNNLSIDTFEFNIESVKEILDLFVDIGVTNIYGIMITNPGLFYDTTSSIKKRIDKYEDKSELARLLNEDPDNLSLIGLL